MNTWKQIKKSTIWKKWTRRSKLTFVLVYKTMLKNPDHIIHAETHPLHEVEWEMICWNAAVIAANAAEGYKTLFEKEKDAYK